MATATGGMSMSRAGRAVATNPLLPLAALVLLLLVLATMRPLREFAQAPPADAVAVERTTLSPGTIELKVRNDGTSDVTIAQVLVDDAFRDHTASRRNLGRLATATIRIPYPWEEGQPLRIHLLTANGITIGHTVEAATLTPRFGSRALVRYGLLGILIGVVPVGLGLLWLPAIRRASPRTLAFLLAFTVGLLAVLLADTIGEGLEFAKRTATSLRGAEVFAAAALAVLAVLAAVERALARRDAGSGRTAALAVAYLVAIGIGLHNLGEGLAVGAAVATGELALGSSLLVGFAAHNTTEGLAITGPLAQPASRLPARHFFGLLAAAGGPTVIGAWAGGLVVSSVWAAAAFGLAAGAIVQVAFVVGRQVLDRHGGVTPAVAAGFVTGLGVMYATGLLTA